MFEGLRSDMRRVARLLTPLLLLSAGPAAAQSEEEPPPQRDLMRMPDLPPAEFDETLTIGGEEIGARKVSSRMAIEVFVNDTGPYKFVVDSGADTSVVGEKIAAKLGLPDASPVMLHSITESKVVDRVEVDSIRLGPTTTTDLLLPVLDERDIGGDGMIGLDALVEQRLLLDFEKRIVTVDEDYDFPNFGPDIIVVTARLRRGQLILTQVRAQGKRVEAVIDTGTEITIGNLAMREHIRKRRPRLIQTIDIYGVTGARETIEFAVVPRLELGPVTFTNVPVAFADLPPFAVFGLSEDPALLLGTDLMEKFRRVSLDFDKRKVRFQLNRCKSSPTTIRTIPTAARLRATQATACAP